jgi:zinc transport system substrate-binding protein
MAVLLSTGCKPATSSNGGGEPIVFVSILPQSGIAKRLAGDAVDVRALVGEGQDPHSFSATPQQTIALGKASALLTTGMPFEEALIGRLNGQIKIVDTLAGVKIREGEEHDGEGDEHDHHDHELDPHVWLAPEALKAQAQNIASALMEIAPEARLQIVANMTTLAEELDVLQADLLIRMKPHSGRTLYVYHPAFGYFADAYRMWQESVQIDGKTPTQKELIAFLKKAKEDEMKILFVQPQFDQKSADAIAKELGAKVESLDSLGEDPIATIKKIADAVDEAFRK